MYRTAGLPWFCRCHARAPVRDTDRFPSLTRACPRHGDTFVTATNLYTSPAGTKRKTVPDRDEKQNDPWQGQSVRQSVAGTMMQRVPATDKHTVLGKCPHERMPGIAAVQRGYIFVKIKLQNVLIRLMNDVSTRSARKKILNVSTPPTAYSTQLSPSRNTVMADFMFSALTALKRS